MDDHNPVKMVRHHHIGVGGHMGKSAIQFQPPAFHHASSLAEAHLAVHNLAEQARPILRDNRDKIRPRRAVIVAP
jgi:hypothetical protein